MGGFALFLMQKWFARNEKTTDKFITKVDDLGNHLSNLNILLNREVDTTKVIQKNCLKREKEVDFKFKKVDETLKNHEDRIKELEP